jgi:copper homeostasis protein
MTLEICIDRIESALAAIDGGAHRLEVCSALELDGLTPSFGLVQQCVELGRAQTSQVEIMMMIRPRAGGFCYGTYEVDTMLRDIRVAKNLGVAGIVLGVLREDGRIDVELCKLLIEAARPLAVTFHRAFDLTPDPYEAFDCLLELGVDRLLTSGQAATALEGKSLLRELVLRAGIDLSVMPGGGIRGSDVAKLVLATGALEIHGSASEATIESGRATRVTKEALVREMALALCACEPTPE